MYDKLLQAKDLSDAGQSVQARQLLSEVNPTVLSEKGQTLYNTISASVDAEAFRQLLSSGRQAFNSGNYEQAVSNLKQIVDVNEGYEDGEALYLYARALHKNGDKDTAADMYEKVINRYAGTKKAEDSQKYLEEIQPE